MTPPVRPEPGGGRVERNVAAMRQQGASEHDIETYLTGHEGLKPSAPSLAPRDVTSAIKREPVTHQSLGQAATGAAEKMNQGASFGLSDEIGALVGGAIASPRHPLKNFEKLRREIAAPAKRFGEEHQLLGAGAELAGALGSGFATGAMRPAAKVTTSPGFWRGALKVGKDVGEGAVVGGGYGAASADPGERMAGARSGAVMGGGMVAGVKLAGALANPLGAATNLMPRPKNVTSPTGRVFKAVGAMTGDDLAHADVVKQLHRAGLTVDDMAANAATAHPEQMLLDPAIGGKSMLRRARGAQSIPSKGSENIEKALVLRGENQPGRVQSALEEGVGHTRENTVLLGERMAGERLANSKPGYDAMKSIVIEDPEALALFDIPEFRDVHKSIVRNAEIRGGEKIQPLTTTSVVGGVKTRVQNPQTLDVLDKVKQHVDDIIAGKIDGGKVTRDRAYAMRDRIIQARSRLDELHPEYAEARAKWAEDSQAIAGHESGLDFIKAGRDEIAAEFPRMSPDQQNAFRRSALNAIEEKLAGTTDGRDVTRIFRNPLMREKLETIFPNREAYQRFEKAIATEGDMHKAGQDVLGGSVTQRIAAEQADDLGGGAQAVGDLANAAAGNVSGLARRLITNSAAARLRGISEGQVNTLAPLLTAKGPELQKISAVLRAIEQRKAKGAATRGVLRRSTAQISGGKQEP